MYHQHVATVLNVYDMKHPRKRIPASDWGEVSIRDIALFLRPDAIPIVPDMRGGAIIVG